MSTKPALLLAVFAVLTLLAAPALGADRWVAKSGPTIPGLESDNPLRANVKLAGFQDQPGSATRSSAPETVETPPAQLPVPEDSILPSENPWADEAYEPYAACGGCTSCLGGDCNGTVCDECLSYGDGCTCSPWGLYAGYGFVFAKPRFSEGLKYFRQIDHAVVNHVVAAPFDYDFELTPRVWVGIDGPRGAGLRVRWWRFDHEDDPARLVVPGDDNIGLGAQLGSPWDGDQIFTDDAGDALFVADDLIVDTLDFEFTQKLTLGCASLTASGGLRYARMSQGYFAKISDNGSVLQELWADHGFEGIGPTLAVEMRRPLGCRGLAVYGGARGSAIFADTHLRARVAEFDDYERDDVSAFSRDADDVLGIAELEIGVEWCRPLFCTGTLLVRGGYEGQLWPQAGSPNILSGDMGFHGFSVAVGIAR